MMNHLGNPFRAAAVAVATLSAAFSAAVEPETPTPPAATPQAEEATPAVASPDNQLQVRYAEARLRLAELDLERALAINEQVHDAIGEREIQRLRNHAAMLKRQVEIAREHPRTVARQASIAAAEAACVDAHGDLDAALRANHRTPGSVSDINVARLRAKVEVAEIRVALCKSPEYELSLLAELEWNIEQLTDEVIHLRHQMEIGAVRDAGQSR